MSSLYSCKKLIKYFYKTKVFENISFDIEKNSIFQIKVKMEPVRPLFLKLLQALIQILKEMSFIKIQSYLMTKPHI